MEAGRSAGPYFCLRRHGPEVRGWAESPKEKGGGSKKDFTLVSVAGTSAMVTSPTRCAPPSLVCCVTWGWTPAAAELTRRDDRRGASPDRAARARRDKTNAKKDWPREACRPSWTRRKSSRSCPAGWPLQPAARNGVVVVPVVPRDGRAAVSLRGLERGHTRRSRKPSSRPPRTTRRTTRRTSTRTETTTSRR